MKKKICIIGGGASGMMAAIAAAEEGAEVTILEHNDRVGRKILSTGNGRCNFTNVRQEPCCYRSDNPDYPWQVISRYTSHQVIAHFRELGIYSRNKNGCLYPFSEQASAVLDVLRMEIERLGICVYTGMHVSALEKKKKGFVITAFNDHKSEQTFRADAVILSCGSRAASKLGADGSGYDLAKAFGHHIIPVVPALVQLRCREGFYKALAGVRVQGKVSVYADGKLLASDTGEIQLTDYGISGIPVFQVSRFASKSLFEKRAVTAELDFMPDFTVEQFENFLKHRITSRPDKQMEMFFAGLFHKKLAAVLLKNAKISAAKAAGNLSEKEIADLVRTVKHFRTEITQTNSFEQAQVCAGGVDTSEICPETMESSLVKNLYFAGEILDVDGMCGGYNLQWAWSSGYLAGKGAAHA